MNKRQRKKRYLGEFNWFTNMIDPMPLRLQRQDRKETRRYLSYGLMVQDRRKNRVSYRRANNPAS